MDEISSNTKVHKNSITNYASQFISILFLIFLVTIGYEKFILIVLVTSLIYIFLI